MRLSPVVCLNVPKDVAWTGNETGFAEDGAVDATDTDTAYGTCIIDGATASTYIPKAIDAGDYLTARAVYKDGHEPTVEDNAFAVSEDDAEVRRDANAAPSFLDEDPAARSVAENVKGASVGNPVTATDTDNDNLLYKLSGDGSDAFKVDKSGQITTAEKLDYETQPSYTIMVTATDSSLASSSITVNITVTDVDDAGHHYGRIFWRLRRERDWIRWRDVRRSPDVDDGLGWRLVVERCRTRSCSRSPLDGVLTFKSSPNYESPADADGDNSYSVTVNRAGGSLDVTVNVENVDEAGSVTLNDLQPQAGAGQSVSASVSDPDGDTVTTAWQWSKSMDQAEWADIDGATSSTYTPVEDDAGYYLRATATYSDGFGTDRDTASAETAFAVEIRPAANAAPSFTDEDDKVSGIQASRTVDETAKVGSSIGDPVAATDTNNDPLLYTLVDYDDPLQGDLDGRR